MPGPLGLCGRYCRATYQGPADAHGEPCIGGLPCPTGAPLPVFMTKTTYGAGESVSFQDTEHYARCAGDYTLGYWCAVPGSVREPQRDFKTGATITNTEVWVGSFESDTVVVTAVEPEGIDREAYEVFGPGIVFDTRLHGELLRRFPTSTYAAYVVWKRFVKGWGGMDAGLVVTTLGRPYPFRTELLPCDRDGRPVGGTETRFEPEGIFRCRAGWMELVLKHHPDAWFADEIRLRLALDRYRLGDPVVCAAGLEELAENGRTDVAAKARDLLSAMRAKGMLPGEGR